MKGDRHTMKSLILTTQDARELDKLGGLTITSPLNPRRAISRAPRFPVRPIAPTFGTS